MLILCIRGKDFGGPSPLDPLYEQIKAEFAPRGVRVVIMEQDDNFNTELLGNVDTFAVVPHSFGMDKGVEIAGDLYGNRSSVVVYIAGLDGVKKREWWNPLASEWKLPPNVIGCQCFLRKGMEAIPPYHSKLDESQNNPLPGVEYDYENIDVEGDHNSMIASCSDQVIDYLKGIFP